MTLSPNLSWMSSRPALIIASRRGVRRPSDTGPFTACQTKKPATTVSAPNAIAAIRKAIFAERLINTKTLETGLRPDVGSGPGGASN